MGRRDESPGGHDLRCPTWNSDDDCTCDDDTGHAPPWIERTVTSFDLETTSPDPNEARIVTATVVRIEPGRDPIVKTWLADPGVDIPAEASEIHGVTTEHAREHGRPLADVVQEIRQSLTDAWFDGPVVAYNASYDLTVMTRECERLGHENPFVVTGPVIDPMVIDKAVDRYRKGRRTLTAACEHYQVRIDGAHDATADAFAAVRVAWKLAHTYPEVGNATLRELHDKQRVWFEQQQTSFAEYLLDKVAARLYREALDLDGAAAELKQAEADTVVARAKQIHSEADYWPIRGAS